MIGLKTGMLKKSPLLKLTSVLGNVLHAQVRPKIQLNAVFGASWWVRQIWSSGISLKRSSKMQLRHVDLRSIGPLSRQLKPKQTLARFSLCTYDGRWLGPLLGKGDIFGQNVFSNISFHWPQDQESALWYSNLQNFTFVKKSNVHFMLVRKVILKVGQKFNILGVIKQILFALHGVHLISIVCNSEQQWNSL